MIEVYRIGENGDDKPIRLKIEDKLILNKKGEPKRFSSYLEALSYGQRLLEKKDGNKQLCAHMGRSAFRASKAGCWG